MEFNAPRAIPNDFFPLSVSFSSKSSYANIKVQNCVAVFNVVSNIVSVTDHGCIVGGR